MLSIESRIALGVARNPIISLIPPAMTTASKVSGVYWLENNSSIRRIVRPPDEKKSREKSAFLSTFPAHSEIPSLLNESPTNIMLSPVPNRGFKFCATETLPATMQKNVTTQRQQMFGVFLYSKFISLSHLEFVKPVSGYFRTLCWHCLQFTTYRSYFQPETDNSHST